jgi:zinc/manganese transport system substrate-binding protein
MRRFFILLALLLPIYGFSASFAVAAQPVTDAPNTQPVRVLVTTNSLGFLVAEIAASLIENKKLELKVLAAPGRDVHYLDARPSFIAAARRADLLIETGAGVEEGWLPVVVSSAANPAINEGRLGRLRVAEHLTLRQSITVTGPHAGHVHAAGNPHFNIDPLRMALASRVIARRLGDFFPDQRAELIKASFLLEKRLKDAAKKMAAQLIEGQRFIAYHEDVDYLEEWLPVINIGYLEPIPGLPPTSKHLRSLVEQHKGDALDREPKPRVIFAAFNPSQGADFLENRLGWTTHPVPIEPEQPNWESYLKLMIIWTDAFDKKY